MAAQSQQLDDWEPQYMSALRKEAEDSYREDQRLALEALLSGGLLAYRSLVEREGAEDFLSQEEVEAILAGVEPSPAQHDREDKDDEERGGGGGGGDRRNHARLDDKAAGGADDSRSLTYFPQLSDVEPPMLDLGWPDERDVFINQQQHLLHHQPHQQQQQHLQLQQQQQLMQARSWSRMGIPVQEAMAMAGVIDAMGGPGVGAAPGPLVEVRFTPRTREEEPNCREAVLRIIRAARTVLGLVCRAPSDPAVLRELLEAARRRVPVYVLVERAAFPAFQRACSRARAPLLAHKFARVRTLGGLRFVTRTGARAAGSVSDCFLVADCTRVATGTYGYTWSDGSLNRCSLAVLGGDACSVYADEFRHLYAQSEAVEPLAGGGLEPPPPPSPPPAYSLLPQVPDPDLGAAGVRLLTPERAELLANRAPFADAIVPGERWPHLMAQRGLLLDRGSLHRRPPHLRAPDVALLLANQRCGTLADLQLRLADGAAAGASSRLAGWLSDARAHAGPEEPRAGPVCRYCGNLDPLREESGRDAGREESSPATSSTAASSSSSSLLPAPEPSITAERSAAIARVVLAAAAAAAASRPQAAVLSSVSSASVLAPSSAAGSGGGAAGKRDAATQTEAQQRPQLPGAARLPLPPHLLPAAAARRPGRYQSLVDLRSDAEGSSSGGSGGGGGDRGSAGVPHHHHHYRQQQQHQRVNRALNAGAGGADATERPANGRKANYTSIRATLESLLHSLAGAPGKRS